MVAESVLARIADNPNLPSPPALTLRILEQASRPSCTIHETGKTISVDPALCSRMLKMVNSSLFGLQRQVTSIDRALNLLGLNHVRSLAMSLSLPALRFRNANSERTKTFWKCSVTTAIVCRELAVRRKWADPDSEMVAGLLCDIGEMFLQELFPDRYGQVLDSALDNPVKDQCTLESEQFNVNHAEAAAYCLSRWKLPEEMTEAVRYHHHPEAAPPNAANRAYLLSFASQVAQLQRGPKHTALLRSVASIGSQRFGFHDDELLTFLESLNPKIDDFAALIDVNLGPRESFTDLFARATENLTRLAVAASLDNFRVNQEKTQTEQSLQFARTSLQKTEEQLRQAQKMEAIGRLAGGVAHDFNNLLTVILGNCDLLLELPAVAGDARAMVEMIRQTGDRAAELTQQLLAFSRKQRLLPEVTQVNDFLSRMMRLVQRLIGDDVQLSIRLAEDLALVRIDPTQLGQVIMNLAVNARDAMPKGGALTIETFNMQLGDEVAHPDLHPGRYAVIAVSDTGCGMDESVLRQAFEPFFTTKDNGKGTGLGLATSHGIIKQSGGCITVDSQVNQGAVFHIYLPASSEQQLPPKTPETAPTDLTGSETILLIDDQEDVCDFVRRSLESFGYKVLIAPNGVDALELEKNYPAPIHLVLTDLVMPRMSGQELARQMAQRRPKIKFLFSSGVHDDSDRYGAITPTMPFLQKPFTPKALAAKIRQVFAGPN